jgi:cytochrome c5
MNKLLKQLSIRSFIVTGIVTMFTFSGAFMTANAGESEKPIGDVSRGAISWAQNCTRCHEMRDPAEFRDDQWPTIVTHMRMRGSLTGRQQRDILAFLQSANNPKPIKVSSATVAEKTSGPALSGKEIYGKTCIACHGADGTGTLPGAPDFTKLEGPLSKSDEILLQHMTEGFQSPGSPMGMPAKGGNPDLTAADLQAALGYLRENFGK